MGKRKQACPGSVSKDRPRRGAAASTQEVLRSPELNILEDPPSSSNYVKKSAEYQKNLQIVKQACDAIDAEVKRRSATIRALAAVQYESFKAQLDLQMSKLSTEELNTPLDEYLKKCPNLKAVKRADGSIQLLKNSSPYPKLEESKRNLQDLLTKAKDGASKGINSSLFSPYTQPNLPASQSGTSQHVTQEPKEGLGGEELDWTDYYMRLQSLGYNAALTSSLGNYNKLNTPMMFGSGVRTGVTPKTLRLPKPGETMLSVNGSPLGRFGRTPASAAGGNTRMTRTQSRLASSKRSLRDL
ncbi:unnamed protein product [Calypogeia fissa]